MTESQRLAPLLEAAGVRSGPRRVETLGGGDTADVRRIRFDDGSSLVVKLGVVGPRSNDPSRLESRAHEEAAGLAAIAATGAVRTPKVIGVATIDRTSILVLEDLGPGGPPDPEDWSAFGRGLADLHAAPVDRFGFDHRNHLGRTPQCNDPVAGGDDWAGFLVERRIAPMKTALAEAGRGGAADLAALDRLADGLVSALPGGIRPGLIHGDLWSGNVHATTDGGIALIDPAVFHGDPLFELGMMRLFGGFPEACEAAYRSRLVEHRGPEVLEAAELRIELGRLHHLLNHWLLFGDGYADQVRRSVDLLSRASRRSRP